MNTFIFNADKNRLSTPQTTKTGKIRKDIHGDSLYSIPVKFDTPEMKTEALRRMKELAWYYSEDSSDFPNELQSGLDPNSITSRQLMEDMLKRWDTWDNGSEIFEAFIIRHNDLLDYIKAHHVNAAFRQDLEENYAIRITARKKVKLPPRTNLDELIK